VPKELKVQQQFKDLLMENTEKVLLSVKHVSHKMITHYPKLVERPVQEHPCVCSVLAARSRIPPLASIEEVFDSFVGCTGIRSSQVPHTRLLIRVPTGTEVTELF
jgi:hypothetical protein